MDGVYPSMSLFKICKSKTHKTKTYGKITISTYFEGLQTEKKDLQQNAVPTNHPNSSTLKIIIHTKRYLIFARPYSSSTKNINELIDFQIVTWLESLTNTSSLISLSSMGKSFEGNDLLLVSISTNNSERNDGDSDFHQTTEHEQESYENSQQKRGVRSMSTGKFHQNKAVIYINCGMHAREWITISSCLWMINEVSYGYLSFTLLITIQNERLSE